MTSAVIMDIIAVVVVVGFLIFGAVRGLFRSFAGLLVIVLSLVGAGFVATQFTPPVAGYVQPFLEKQIEQRLEGYWSTAGALQEFGGIQMPEVDVDAFTGNSDQTGESSSGAATSTEGTGGLLENLQIQQLLKLLKWDQDPSASITQAAKEQMQNTGTSALTAVLGSVARTIIHVLLFVISFMLISILLKLAVHLIDKVLELPGLSALNRMGGAAIGVAEGALVLFLAIWIMRRVGVSFETDAVASTYYFKFFTTHTPLSVLSFL